MYCKAEASCRAATQIETSGKDSPELRREAHNENSWNHIQSFVLKNLSNYEKRLKLNEEKLAFLMVVTS
jgi:hypothetical protein